MTLEGAHLVAFKIISVGWNCEAFLDWTLASVDAQTRRDWELCVVYDPSPDLGAEKLREWCAERFNARCLLNSVQQGAVRNQFEGLRTLRPADEDIVVFLDLDGDRLAHPEVLQRLADFYADGTLLTYGSYRPVPDPGTTSPAIPFPREVIEANSYREYVRTGGPCCFNHLRTMKGKVFNAIPPSYFRWPDSSWFTAGTDYLFMLAGLELAGPRHKCITETLLLYNHANPYADNLVHPAVTRECVAEILRQTPLTPLE